MFDLWRSEKHKREVKERQETSAEDRSQAVALELFSDEPNDPCSSSTAGRRSMMMMMPVDQASASTTAASSRKSSSAESDDALMPPWQVRLNLRSPVPRLRATPAR